MSSEDIQQAHKHSVKSRQEVLGIYICACFHCHADFHPEEITVWWDDDVHGIGQTAVCPRCGIDSVIRSQARLPIDQEFLGKKQHYYF